jgi:hypothetical protein
MSALKASILFLLVVLSGCSWFHARKPPAPPPTELIVTGAPANSLLLVDGVQKEQVAETGRRPYVLTVAPGPHTLEVKRNDKVVYREDVDVGPGEKRTVTVLSGTGGLGLSE